jgi:hypothetical protein
MPRRSGGVDDRAQGAQRRGGRQDAPAAAVPEEPLSPPQRRIAEALAELLVAHYRRQHDALVQRASAPPALRWCAPRKMR